MTKARERFRPVLLITLVVSSVLSACSVNPVTGERELVLMSTEQEKALGAQAAEQVEQQIGLVDDPELTAYIRAIGERLAADSPRQDVEYRFSVADMEVPNAFAWPGGYIYVSRGLLALLRADRIDELERKVGQQALEADFFQQALRLSESVRPPSERNGASAPSPSSARGRGGKAR